MKVWNKTARHLNGRMEFRAVVGSADAVETYPWKCQCRVGDKHDHDAVHRRIAEGLSARERVIASLRMLEGHTEELGVVRFTIRDCNIRIHGPAKWELYVSWDQEDTTGQTPKQHKIVSVAMDHPDKLPSGDALALVRKSVQQASDLIVGAHRAVNEFLGKK